MSNSILKHLLGATTVYQQLSSSCLPNTITSWQHDVCVCVSCIQRLCFYRNESELFGISACNWWQAAPRTEAVKTTERILKQIMTDILSVELEGGLGAIVYARYKTGVISLDEHLPAHMHKWSDTPHWSSHTQSLVLLQELCHQLSPYWLPSWWGMCASSLCVCVCVCVMADTQMKHIHIIHINEREQVSHNLPDSWCPVTELKCIRAFYSTWLWLFPKLHVSTGLKCVHILLNTGLGW